MDDINELPFKLRFTSTEKLCKEIIKLIEERYDAYDKLCAEYENIGEHKLILGNIKSDLQTSHDALKQLRALCQCQSDDDKNIANKQLANNEEIITKLENKYNGIATIKMVDISVKRLPSNWRAAMLKIARDKANNEFADSVNNVNNDSEKMENNGEVTNGGGDQTKIENNNDNQNFDETISKEVEVITEQFEMDLERKIYETQVEELMAMVQMLIMRIKTIKARIDISKQLIKVAIKLKREYETSNSKLKETMATCHCAEAGADDDIEFQKKMEEKKSLEETVERITNDLKYWEEQYSILKEGRNTKNKEEPTAMEVPATTTVVVAQEEMEDDLPPIASTSSQQSCMYATHTSASQSSNSNSQQGTANPAVIYLEGLVAHQQQPTYIPAANLHQPLSMYQHYPLGHPHHSYHQAPDGSIQVYSSDISTHPGYIAYQ